MTDPNRQDQLANMPIELIAPVRLKKEATAGSCGLFFPHERRLELGLTVDWEGATHLIHLDGDCIFRGTSTSGKRSVGWSSRTLSSKSIFLPAIMQ